MSDTTDMMLDGTLCRECGVYRGPEPGDSGWEIWEPEGYPCLCADCAKRPQKKRKAQRKVAVLSMIVAVALAATSCVHTHHRHCCCGWYR